MLSQCSGDFCFLVITNHYRLIVIDFDSLVILTFKPGGVGHSYIWATRVCAAQQGMLFASLTQELGIKITLSLWKRVYFTLGLTLEQGRFFPES